MGERRISARIWEITGLAALIFGLISRFFAQPHAPFWIDETSSGGFVSAPDFRTFLNLIQGDVNGPLYYFVLRAWSSAFGMSDTALRSLSLVLSAAAPLMLVLTPAKGLRGPERLAWAALTALWIPGIGYAQVAKPAALVLFLGAAQTLAFIALLRRPRPTLAQATLWVGICCLGVEAHYHDVWLAVAQGLTWICVRRGAAVRCWPAALLILPVLAEVGLKAAMLTQFTSPGVTWYPLVRLDDLPLLIGYAFGSLAWPFVFLALVAASAILGRQALLLEEEPDGRILALTALASLLGTVAFVAACAVRPLMAFRYLAPFAPGLLLGVVLVLRLIARSERYIAYTIQTLLAVLSCAHWLATGARHPDSNLNDLNTETASHALIRAHVRRVVFAWDNPMFANMGMRPVQADAVGGFFFHQAALPVEVIPAFVRHGDDPNAVLLSQAKAHRAAILWLYDDTVPGTSAISHPPRIDILDRSWTCRNFSRGGVGSVACWPKGVAADGGGRGPPHAGPAGGSPSASRSLRPAS